MLIQKFQPLTPTKRFLRIPLFLNQYQSFFKYYNHLFKFKKSFKNLSNKLVIFNFRKNKHHPLPLISKIPNINLKVVSTTHITHRLIYKSCLVYNTIWGFFFIFPKTKASYLGNILYLSTKNLDSFKLIKHFCLFVSLSFLEPQTEICYLSSPKLKNWAYICSVGCSGLRLSDEKRTRLIPIQLPSTKIKYFNRLFFCLLGPVDNAKVKYFYLGKFSSIIKKSYFTKVRGVAKNPVDHPHGGRTKSNQPEVSPWGWVTKNSH